MLLLQLNYFTLLLVENAFRLLVPVHYCQKSISDLSVIACRDHKLLWFIAVSRRNIQYPKNERSLMYTREVIFFILFYFPLRVLCILCSQIVLAYFFVLEHKNEHIKIVMVLFFFLSFFFFAAFRALVCNSMRAPSSHYCSFPSFSLTQLGKGECLKYMWSELVLSRLLYCQVGWGDIILL